MLLLHIKSIDLNLNEIIPLACNWVQLKEREILDRGIPLTKEMMDCAKRLGVKYPDKVKIMLIDKIPTPEDPILKAACHQTNLISGNTAGLTLRYGIYVRQDCKTNRNLYLHEFVHVSQYEKLGGIEQFLKQYLQEVLTIGYPKAPMEQEAINKIKEI